MLNNDVLEKLHNKYFGAQDVYNIEKVNTLSNFKHNGNVEETRTFTYNVSSNDRHFRHTISFGNNLDNKNINESYTNFKINPAGFIDEIILKIGESQIEKINHFKFLKSEPILYLMSGDRGIPLLQYHTNELHIKTLVGGTFTISYDVVTSDYYNLSQEGLIYQEQWSGKKYLENKLDTHIKLDFYHPVIKLYAHISSDDIQDIRLLLDDIDYNLILTKEYNYYSIEFGDKNSINFSRINKAVLKITTNNIKEKTEVNIFCISKNILRKMAGMAGIAYLN